MHTPLTYLFIHRAIRRVTRSNVNLRGALRLRLTAQVAGPGKEIEIENRLYRLPGQPVVETKGVKKWRLDASEVD
jgi:hypothetical protein